MKQWYIALLFILVLLSTCRYSFFVDHADTLRRDGVVVIPNTFPRVVRQQAWSSILQAFGTCRNRITGDINQSSNKRFDVALTLTPSIQRIIRHIYARHRDVWTTCLQTDNPRLVELSALITFPGARAQDWHRDVSGTYTRLLSIGVAMQDITSDMAPLEVVKGTHTHDDDVDDEDEIEHSKKMTCTKDTIVVWDGGVHHRGSANTSDIPRIMLYFTLARDGRLPSGSTYTIKQEYTRPYLRMNSL